jgi:arylsulfatase A-like enzyme
MSKTKETSVRENHPGGDYQGDLIVVSRVLYKRRWLIILGTVVFTCLSFILSLLLPRVYYSKGFFQISEIVQSGNHRRLLLTSELLDTSKLTILRYLKEMGLLEFAGLSLYEDLDQPDAFVVSVPEFNQHEAILKNGEEFMRFVRSYGLLEPGQVEALEKKVSGRGLSDCIERVYAFNDEDLEIKINRTYYPTNFIIGLNLKMWGKTAESARKNLQVLGEYIKNTIVYKKLKDFLRTKRNYLRNIINLYLEFNRMNKLAEAQLLEKRDRILSLLSTAGEAAELRSDLTNIRKRLLDLDLLKSSVQTELQKSRLCLHFFSVVLREMRQSEGSTLEILTMIENLQDTYLKDKKLDEPLRKELALSIQNELSNFKEMLGGTMRFRSGPTRPQKPSQPPTGAVVILGFFLGLLVFVFLALFLDFLQKNAAKIKGKEGLLLCLLVLTSLLVTAGCGSGSSASADKPNIILLVNDAWRRDSLGCYAPDSPNTPHIDEFFRQGVIFKNAFSQSPKTINSSASMFCSVYPAEHGYNNYQLRISSELTSIAELLKQSGYITLGISANPHVTRRNGLAQGFDEFIEFLYWKDSPSCSQVNDMFMKWLRRHKEQRFFAMLWYIDTHSPYNPPQGFIDKYIPPDQRKLVTDRLKRPSNKEHFNESEREIARKLYAAAVRYFDAEFHRLAVSLEKEDLLKNSVIILTSDHGESFWERRGFSGREMVGHGNCLHAEEINIPLLMRLPELTETVVVEEAAQHIDLLPTIVALAGGKIDSPRHYVRGESLVPLFRGGNFKERPFVFTENISTNEKGEGAHMRGIQDIRHKLIVNNPIGDKKSRANRLRFFDLRAGEKLLEIDLAEVRPLVKEFRRQLARWRSTLEIRRFSAALIQGEEKEQLEGVKEKLKTLGYLD